MENNEDIRDIIPMDISMAIMGVINDYGIKSLDEAVNLILSATSNTIIGLADSSGVNNPILYAATKMSFESVGIIANEDDIIADMLTNEAFYILTKGKEL